MPKERSIKIALVQMKSEHGNTKINLERGIKFIAEASDNGADLVCLPELFYTGYHLSSAQFQELAEPVDGPFVQTLCQTAKEKGVYIIAGYPESVDIPGRIYNSAVFINDKGDLLGNMRKVYIFGQEKDKFRPGNQYPVFDTPLGKIGLMICYDIEFPEPMRIMALKGAELVILPSVFSIPWEIRWNLYLAGAAGYNLLFTAGINTIEDGACGSSLVAGPDGVIRAKASRTEEEILYYDIDLSEIIKTRSIVPYYNDFKEDTFTYDAIKNY